MQKWDTLQHGPTKSSIENNLSAFTKLIIVVIQYNKWGHNSRKFWIFPPSEGTCGQLYFYEIKDPDVFLLVTKNEPSLSPKQKVSTEPSLSPKLKVSIFP